VRRLIQKIRKFDFLKWGQALLLSAMILAPVVANAQLPGPQCGTLNGVRCEELGLVDLIVKGINLLLGVAFVIAVLFLVIGGFRYIVAQGNPDAAKAGKQTIVNALIGIIIIILSYVLVSVVSRTIGNSGTGSSGSPL
jgi:hypothetical protein